LLSQTISELQELSHQATKDHGSSTPFRRSTIQHGSCRPAKFPRLSRRRTMVDRHTGGARTSHRVRRPRMVRMPGHGCDIILGFIEHHSLDPWPLRSLTPAVRQGDADWGHYGTLNLPHQYHNGGAWTFIEDSTVAALAGWSTDRRECVAKSCRVKLASGI
jgi:hypothetical protein